MVSHSHAQQQTGVTARKALRFLAEFSSVSDSASVHIDRVNKALRGDEIDRLVKAGAIDGVAQQRGNVAMTRTFHVGILEALSGTTLQAVRDELSRPGPVA